jgi:hypothetical protein
MSRPKYKILASLYQLLSTATADELRETSKLPQVSEHIRTALLALAAEISGITVPNDRNRSTGRTARSTVQIPAISDSVLSSSKRAAIVNLLSNERKFPNKASLARFAQEIGAGVEISSKWGRPRAISALASAIEKSPQVLSRVDLSDEKLDPNTKGWIDIILGRK